MTPKRVDPLSFHQLFDAINRSNRNDTIRSNIFSIYPRCKRGDGYSTEALVSRSKSKVPTVVSSNNSLLREGLSRILTSRNYNVVASTSSLDLLSPLKLDEAELLLLGVGQDAENSLSQLRMFRELNQGGYVVIIAENETSSDILPILRAGAHACLNKDTTFEALLKTIELVMLGGTVVPRDLLRPLFNNEEASGHETVSEPIVYNSSMEVEGQPTRAYEAPGDNLPTLSPQEKRILSRLIVGESNKSVARNLNIAEATVKVHVKAIFRKLGMKNRTQVAVWGLNQSSQIPTAGAPTTILPSAEVLQPTSVVEGAAQTS
jgi:two-component system nitrate/nitrite response regulator NarL